MKKTAFVYGLVLFLCMTYPLWIHTGYLFFLDSSLSFDNTVYPWYFSGILDGFRFLWQYVRKITPFFMYDRLIIMATFGLLMTGAYQMTKATKNIYAILFAITLVSVNPFIYSRILDGQSNVYLASALFVWFVYFLQRAFRTRAIYHAIIIGIFTVFLALTSVYSLYLALFSYGIFFCVHFFGSRYKKIFFQRALVTGFVALAINAFWFLPIIGNIVLPQQTNSSAIVQGVQQFNSYFYDVFSTKPGLYDVSLNTALLRGYWGESQTRFLTLDVWYKHPIVGVGLMMLIWLCVGGGVIYHWRHKTHRLEAISIFLLGVVGYILTLGVAPGTLFRPVVQMLYDYLPLYGGFRESQKWIILLIVAYAYFGAYGICEFFVRLGVFRLRRVVMIFLVFVPVISTPLMLFGFFGQLRPQHFPSEWRDVREYLQTMKPTQSCDNMNVTGRCYTVLYFPWHSYIGLGWNKHTSLLWNMTSFITPLQYNLVGDNDQIGTHWSTSSRPESRTIERYIRRRGQQVNALEQLQEMHAFYTDIRKMGIQYIVLLKDNTDSENYIQFLDMGVEERLFEIAKENRLIKIYKTLITIKNLTP